MREHVKADEPFVREDVSAGDALERFVARGAGLQGRADRGPRPRRGRRDRLALHQRPVHRPLPRARTRRRRARGRVQAPVGRRRVLARQGRQPDAHARLRHGVRRRRRSSTSTSSASSRPAPATTASSAGARAVHVLRAVAPAHRSGSPTAWPSGTRWPTLWREQNSARGYREVKTPILYDVELWKQSGPLGQVPRAHVLHRGGGSADGPQAHELPGAHPALQGRAPLLPRPADPLRRAGARPPPRAERDAPRPAARAPHHPGRRPHLLHARPDRGRGPGLPGLRLLPLRAVRLRAAARALDPARTTGSAPTSCGTRPRARWRGALERRGLAYEIGEGEGTFYGPEDRPPHDRLDRPLVAARHRPARLPDARALRPGLHRRRQRRAPAGDDPPRAVRLLRALHRHPHRALRRRVPGVAGAGAGDRAADRRPPRRVRGVGGRAAARGGRARRARRPLRVARPRASATPSCARSPTSSSPATARWRPARSRCASTARATRARSRSTSSPSVSRARPPSARPDGPRSPTAASATARRRSSPGG